MRIVGSILPWPELELLLLAGLPLMMLLDCWANPSLATIYALLGPSKLRIKRANFALHLMMKCPK